MAAEGYGKPKEAVSFVDDRPSFSVHYRTIAVHGIFHARTRKLVAPGQNMMDTKPNHSWLAASALALMMSCGGKDGDTAAVSNCALPLAEAGDSQVLPLGASIGLNATDSTHCSEYKPFQITYTWGFDRIPADSAISNEDLSENATSTSDQPSFVPDVPGEYVLSLRVSDPINASSPDFVVITIVSDDLPPTADCGGDRIGTVGLATTMNGRASFDPEGSRLGFTWGVSSTPGCSTLTSTSLYDQGTPAPSIVPDCDGLYILSLVVSDGLHWSEPDYCTVDVRSDNGAPVAEAGPGGSLPACTLNPFQLSGWESHDPEGDPMTYSWSVVSAPPGADPAVYGFDDAALVAPHFTWDRAGEWSFQLQVADPHQTSPPDVVTYIVGDVADNNSPTANAGGDQTVLVEADCSTSSYVFTCEECPITYYTLDGSGSSDPDGDTLQYNWSELSGTLAFTGTTTPVTNIILPANLAEHEVNLSTEYEIQLDVNDCSREDDDRITLTYTCRGEYVPPELPF